MSAASERSLSEVFDSVADAYDAARHPGAEVLSRPRRHAASEGGVAALPAPMRAYLAVGR